MAITTRTIEYKEGENTFEGVLAYPSDLQHPSSAVIVFHAFAGRDAFAVGRAEALAQLGYVSFAVDVYGKGVLGKSHEENYKLLTPFLKDRDMLLRRINAALDITKSCPEVDPMKVAAIGYCFGGLCVLDLARSLRGEELKGVVSFHGSLDKPPNSGEDDIKAKVLALHGASDYRVNPQVAGFQEEMTKRNADWQLHSYGHAYHAFAVPGAKAEGVEYSESADRRSWQSMQNFLQELF